MLKTIDVNKALPEKVKSHPLYLFTKKDILRPVLLIVRGGWLSAAGKRLLPP